MDEKKNALADMQSKAAAFDEIEGIVGEYLAAHPVDLALLIQEAMDFRADIAKAIVRLENTKHTLSKEHVEAIEAAYRAWPLRDLNSELSQARATCPALLSVVLN